MAVAALLLLFVSIIGIPWAIRQAIRWAFFPQVLVFERRPRGAGLGRSSELVRGRWWRTAALPSSWGSSRCSALVVGLGLVLLFTTAPLPLVNIIGALVNVGAPYVAVALTLAYGDRVARGLAGRRQRRWTRLWREGDGHGASPIVALPVR